EALSIPGVVVGDPEFATSLGIVRDGSHSGPPRSRDVDGPPVAGFNVGRCTAHLWLTVLNGPQLGSVCRRDRNSVPVVYRAVAVSSDEDPAAVRTDIDSCCQ